MRRRLLRRFLNQKALNPVQSHQSGRRLWVRAWLGLCSSAAFSVGGQGLLWGGGWQVPGAGCCVL